MYFLDVVGVLLRRWLIVAIGAGITVALGVLGAVFVQPTYQATGQLIVLLPAKASGTNGPTNPYLNLEPGLTIASSLIAATLNTAESQDSVAQANFKGTYAVSVVPGSGPIIDISAEAKTGPEAVATRNEVIRRLNIELARIQDLPDVPSRQLMYSRPNSVTTQADAVIGSKIRALAAIGGLGVVCTLIVAFVTDFRKHPRRRPEQRPVASGEPPERPGPAADAQVPEPADARPVRARVGAGEREPARSAAGRFRADTDSADDRSYELSANGSSGRYGSWPPN